MARYDRGYDYGLRGARDLPRGPRYDHSFSYERRRDPEGRRANRVTAPYNLDYVYGGRGDRFPRNYNMYTGDRPDRMGDERWYRRPYITTGGTHTLRGAPFPTGYDYPDYGPDYGGRYPDEV